MTLARTSVLALLFGLSSVALAQDELDDDIFGEEDDDEEFGDEEIKRVDEDDTLDTDTEPEPGSEDWVDKVDEEGANTLDPEEMDIEDEFGADSDVAVSGPGQDNARIYREQLERVEDLPADEEALSWEKYLKKYPNSVFKARIDDRLDELSKELYEGRLEDPDDRFKDRGQAELKFAQPLLLENIDPRSKIRAGFEWGFPDYFNLLLDAEYQLRREWSVHGGIRNRYTGTNIEAGTRYAIIKSARTNTLLTAIGDVHLNMNPMHVGIRPQLAFGQRFAFGETYLDAIVQGGSDLLMLSRSDGKTVLSPRVIGGAHIAIVPNETVRIYIETNTYMKGMGDSTVPATFRFNTFTFGMKFVQRKSATKDLYEAGFGASAPYSAYYWSYHYGSVTADVNYYLDG